jgi:tryptophan synthase alpha chain
MGRLDTTFAALHAAGRKALVVYLTASDPDEETSVAAGLAALEAGADVLEIGVPFSDPIADGPIIQRAMQRALRAGGGLTAALRVVSALRARSAAPLVLFGDLNPLLWSGFEGSVRAVAEAGADGMLVVDAPPEEAEPLRLAVQRAGLDWVSLVAPTTPPTRAAAIAQAAGGFLYVVSMTGVTGGALQGVEAVQPLIAQVRAVASLPVCVGFGVRDAASAGLAASVGDGVVVGSAVVKALEEGGPDAVAACVRELRRGIDAPARVDAKLS